MRLGGALIWESCVNVKSGTLRRARYATRRSIVPASAGSLGSTRRALARMPTRDCPPARSAWAPDEPAVAHRSDQPPRSAVSSAESRFYQQTISSAPLFIADAFVPALLLYHPPRGLRHGGLAGHCNNSARKVSRAGACDMLSAAEALVRNATLPSTPHRFGRCAVVGSNS